DNTAVPADAFDISWVMYLHNLTGLSKNDNRGVHSIICDFPATFYWPRHCNRDIHIFEPDIVQLL
ncbi:unnamed protein product, partial [Heterosigma akashiwo]